jgi:hypothetical protein
LGFSRGNNALDGIKSYAELIKVVGEIGRSVESVLTPPPVVGSFKPRAGGEEAQKRKPYTNPELGSGGKSEGGEKPWERPKHPKNLDSILLPCYKAGLENGTCFNCGGNHTVAFCDKNKTMNRKKAVASVAEARDEDDSFESFRNLPGVCALRVVATTRGPLKRKFDTGAEHITVVKTTHLLTKLRKNPVLENFHGGR